MTSIIPVSARPPPLSLVSVTSEGGPARLALALMETLSDFVGDEFTPAMAGAWSEVLNDVSATMIGTHEAVAKR